MKKIDKIVSSIRKTLLENKELDEEKIERFNKIIPGSKNPLMVKILVITKIANNIWKDMKETNIDEILLICDHLWFNNEYYEEYKVIIFLLEKFVKKEPKEIIKGLIVIPQNSILGIWSINLERVYGLN